jgi:hypothetical protein
MITELDILFFYCYTWFNQDVCVSPDVLLLALKKDFR